MPVRCEEGRFYHGRIPVLTSVFHIPERLKELSESLFVMFNTDTQRYEVHDAKQPDTSLCCELPYDELDARALDYVREHHVSRLAEIAAEIDAYNEKLDADRYNAKLDKANYKLREAVRYLDGKSVDTIPKELIAE